MEMKLKNNLERFFFEKAADYGIDPEYYLSKLQEIDYQKLYTSIVSQKRPLRGYTGFVAHKWRHDCSYRGEYHPKATLLQRVLKTDEEIQMEDNYEFEYTDSCSRHYMELWVDHEMQLQVVSCLQTEIPDDYYEADYVTQYRKLEGSVWPDTHGEVDLAELLETLKNKEKRASEYNQVPLFIPLRGDEGLMYELYMVKNGYLQG